MLLAEAQFDAHLTGDQEVDLDDLQVGNIFL